MKRLMLLFTVLFVIPMVVSAVTVREACFNETHKLETFEYALILDGVTSTINYTQLHQCQFNCTVGSCAGIDREADTLQMWIVFGLGAFLLTLGTALGIPYGYLANKEKIEGFDTKMAVRYLFFFVGFYLMYLSLGIARRIGYTYGGVADITGAMETTISVMTWVLLIFAFLFVIEFIITALGMWKVKKEKEKWGEWDESAE